MCFLEYSVNSANEIFESRMVTGFGGIRTPLLTSFALCLVRIFKTVNRCHLQESRRKFADAILAG